MTWRLPLLQFSGGFDQLRPTRSNSRYRARTSSPRLHPSNNNNLTATALRTSGHDPSTATNLPISSSDKYLSRLFSRFIEMLTHGLSTRPALLDREVEKRRAQTQHPIRAGRFARFRQIEMQGLDVLDADVRDAVVLPARSNVGRDHRAIVGDRALRLRLIEVEVE
jgi:hypothetical protein